MTSRERVRAALDRADADRVPCDMWAEPEVFAALRAELCVDTDEDVLKCLQIDMRWIVPDYIGPQNPEYPDGSTADPFGIRRRCVNYGRGHYQEIAYHPLANAGSVSDILNHDWPDPAKWDYAGMRTKVAHADACGEVWIGIGSGSFFERAWSMRGMENFLMDLAVDTEMACVLMDRLGEFYLEHTERMLQAVDGRADMLYTADDIGAQRGLIISLDMWRKHVMPRQAAFNDHFKRKYGVKIFYHSCGAIEPLIPYLIDIGVDILNPLQFSAEGMNPNDIKAKYGDKLTFHGGIDVQTTLAHGSLEDVRAEVKERLGVLGEGGGYILAPAHNIQVDTSVEKILAMYELAQGMNAH
ncbi:MAG: hypothetical protein HYX78_00335 [Armatimonadetes bacterium]|nr:hypothetical protein [Armatimonadota bacterium]